MTGLGGFFIFVLATAVTAAFFCWGGARDRRFLAGLFLTGFLLRVVFSLSLDFTSGKVMGSWPAITGAADGWFLGVRDQTRGFLSLGDSDYYSERAWAYAQFARGSREPVILYRVQETGWNPYPVLMGAFYYVFGFSPFSVKFLNALFGALLGPVLFGLIRRWGMPEAARLAALLVSLWPSLVLWSISNLKDPLFFLCTALLFYGAAMMEGSCSWRRRGVILTASGIVFYLHVYFDRPEFSWVLVVLLTFPLFARWAKRRSWFWIVPAAGCAGFLLLLPRVEAALALAYQRHLAYVYSTGIVYRYLPDRFYEPFNVWNGSVAMQPGMWDMLMSFPKAVFHFLIEPFPSRTSDSLTLFALPQTVLWYELLPFAFWGMFRARIGAPVSHLWLVLTLCVWTAMMALSMGNIGTLFRARDMLTPFVLLYAAIGICEFVRFLSNARVSAAGKAV